MPTPIDNETPAPPPLDEALFALSTACELYGDYALALANWWSPWRLIHTQAKLLADAVTVFQWVPEAAFHDV